MNVELRRYQTASASTGQSLRSIARCLLIVLCWGAPAACDDDQWVQLFDGETLQGWTARGDAEVTVADGELRIRAEKNVWVVTDAVMSDFVLEVEAKVAAGEKVNSGIAFRCQGMAGKPKGYQCEIDTTDRAFTGGLHAIGTGWVHPRENDQQGAVAFRQRAEGSFDRNGWNHFRIVCRGDRIRIYTNDVLTTDVRDGLHGSGYFALQNHGGGGENRFRNVRVRELRNGQPHIVLVMADDQGWGDMAYNGHPHLKTPHFDNAAASGLRFDRFYAAAPVCSPTRASVMTGRHPNRMGVFKWGYPIRPQETTLAEALRTAGYMTGHFGKWHLGSVRNNSPAHPGRNGFDEWLSAPNFFDNDPILSQRGRAVQTHGESSTVVVDAALKWIRENARNDQPVLAVVWFGSPHGPHKAIERDRAIYADQPERLQHFYGEITGMDRAFGRLRDGLEDVGMRDNTILWYCSDNGALPNVGSSGGMRGNKGNVYEGGLLVPSILEWPERIRMPRTTVVRCNTCDIYPTLLEIAGVTVSPQPELDGISLVPLIDGKMQHRREPMGFWDYTAKGIGTPSAQWMGQLLAAQQSGGDLEPHESSRRAADLPEPPLPETKFPGHAAWTDSDWKLHRIAGKKGDVRWEFYNLAVDPKETTDLSGTEGQRVRNMRGHLETWLHSVVRSLNGHDYRPDPDD